MRHTITRRQFLKVGGAAVVSTAAAGLLSSCGGSSASGSSTGGSGSSTYTLLYSYQRVTNASITLNPCGVNRFWAQRRQFPHRQQRQPHR